MKCYSLTVLLFFLFASAALAESWGGVYEATVNLKVRAARNADAEHLQTLVKGQQVKVGAVKNGWAAVFPQDAEESVEAEALGFASAMYLKPVAMETKADTFAADNAIDEPNSAVTPDSKPIANVVPGEITAPVEAAPPTLPTSGIDPSRIPVQISSDRLTYDESGKQVAFEGNVLAEHGELKLTAEKLSAHFVSGSVGEFSADSVDRIVATGNVVATRGDSVGRCEKVTYFVQKQLLRLEGDPILKDGPNSLTGKVINFYLRENRSEVVGGDGKRVKAIFLAPDSIKGQ